LWWFFSWTWRSCSWRYIFISLSLQLGFVNYDNLCEFYIIFVEFMKLVFSFCDGNSFSWYIAYTSLPKCL
jgi:hypothetical protein